MPPRGPDGQAHPPVRLLTFTTLYPHAGMPNQGVFVENRLRHLIGTGRAVSTVLAPVPWFPSEAARYGTWSRFAQAGQEEHRHGVRVLHPRYAVIPKVGMPLAPFALYLAASRSMTRLLRQGAVFDVIDSHYLYPDGVAAVAIGRRFGLPVVMTARGSDVTQLPEYWAPRRMIRQAMADADAMISVSAGLRTAMMALGADGERITVLRNGVDLVQFRPPQDRAQVRATLGVSGPTLVSVGHLIPRKGHNQVIAALAALPEWRLMVVGEGPERARLEALAARLGVADRVRFLGAQPHAALGRIYGAADLLVLASSREGWANVLLEAMACGTAVVASDIPGNDEVVQNSDAGLIVGESGPAGIAAGVQVLWAKIQVQPDRSRAATRRYAEAFSWDATSAGQIDVFEQALTRFRERGRA